MSIVDMNVMRFQFSLCVYIYECVNVNWDFEDRKGRYQKIWTVWKDQKS